MSDITLMLQAVARGEKRSAEDLLSLVYDELRRVATARMARESAGHTLQPTALVHEAWLRLVNEGDRTWQNRVQFFSAAAEAMRRILIERARRKSRLKRGAGQERVNIEDLEVVDALPDERILMVDEALERLKSVDPETARVVVLKFFGGLNNEEIVQITGTSDRTVRRQWNYAKTWLFKCISEGQ